MRYTVILKRGNVIDIEDFLFFIYPVIRPKTTFFRT